MARSSPVILSACRTPIGKYLGRLVGPVGRELGRVAVARGDRARRASIRRTVDEVIVGNVLQAGVWARTRPGRRRSRPGCRHHRRLTVNKVCGSGPQGGHARRPGDPRRRRRADRWPAAWRA